MSGVGGRFWENGRRTSILWSLHREFHARYFDIRFYILLTMRSLLICLSYRTTLIRLPGIFFSMESMGLTPFLKFGTKPQRFNREKLEKWADLRVEHGLHWHLAWHGVTLEKKRNRIWNQRISENKRLDCLPLLLASLATAALSLPYYQILNEVSDLLREKSH